MSIVQVPRAGLFPVLSPAMKSYHKLQIYCSSWTMTTSGSRSPQTGKKEELILEHQKPAIPQFERVSHSSLHFNQLQPLDQELVQENTIEFGQFVARKAMLDEEYWTAAWLRAESHWENQTNERYVNNYKRKFAEQEFNALKRRCRNLHKHKCTCIVTMRKENKNVKRTVLKSILGTLDLSIGHLLPGETFSGERVQAPPFCSIDRTSQNRYGYIANLCVAKSARCQGIATNMMYFAVQLAKSGGVEHVFVHVHKDNIPAKKLYQKMGFEVFPVTFELSFWLQFKALYFDLKDLMQLFAFPMISWSMWQPFNYPKRKLCCFASLRNSYFLEFS